MVSVVLVATGPQPSSGAAPSAPAAPTVPGCPDASDALPGTTLAEQRTALTGVWVRCSSASALPSEWGPPEAGLEFTADGHWYRISRSTSGTLVREQGAGNEGTYPFLGNPGSIPPAFQLNITDLTGFTTSTFAVRYATPAVLTLQEAGYTLWTGAPPSPAPPAPPSPGCPGAGAAYTPSDPVDALTRLAGTWIRCSPGSVLPSGWGPAEAGLELTTDGHMYRLYPGPNGLPVRGTGAFDSGTVVVQRTDPGLLLELSAGGFTIYASGVVFTQPRILHLLAEGMPVTTGTYVAWDGSPLPGAPAPATPSASTLPPTR